MLKGVKIVIVYKIKLNTITFIFIYNKQILIKNVINVQYSFNEYGFG